MPIGFSVRVFLPDADPEGVKVVEKSNWSGQGIVIPRASFGSARSRPEMKRTGVYMLVGPDPQVDMQRVYIGEGDPILDRLQQHDGKKEFWTHLVAFTSKDQNLNKAHIQHIEARLVQLARSAKRSTIDNVQDPNEPSMSEADRAEAEGYLADLLLCMPILGYTFLVQPPVVTSGVLKYSLRSRGSVAQGFNSPQGFVVLKGSLAAKESVPSVQPHHEAQRKAFVEKGLFVEKGDVYELTQDYSFGSPSAAAGVMTGASLSGLEHWKTSDGRTLKSVLEAETTA